MAAIRQNSCFTAIPVLLSLALAVVGVGCQEVKTGSPSTPTTPAKTLDSISVSPSNPSILAGATQQFAATAKYSDSSTANVTSSASWSSATVGIGTVNANGLASAVAAGSTTITASLSGISGTATLSVTATPRTLTSITVSPGTSSISYGATEQFGAAATYSDGSTGNVTSTASWASSTPAVATIDASGLATGAAAGSTSITASIGGISGSANLSVTKSVTSVAISPATASILEEATEQFSATANYNDGSTANVTSTANWISSTPPVATVSSSALATGVAQGLTTITASLTGVSGSATLAVTIANGANIPTFHADAQRSGLNSNETTLTPANVTASSFGKLFSYVLDGYVYGEPLLVSNVTINGASHDVLFAATENDSVYAFDADSNAGSSADPLWRVSLLQSGETPMTDGPIQPVQGVTSTPAIDLTSNTMYVVSMQTSASGSSFRLNALDITTGAQKYGGPVTIQASVPGTNSDSVNGVVSLTTSCLQRAALLVADGSVFIGFGSCHSGWLLAYDEQTLTQTGVFNMSPNLNGEGAFASAGGVWMGGGGPASDGTYIYVTTGNGPFDASQQSYGDSVLKFNAQLQLQDYFTPFDYQYMDCADADLAAGGLLLIPGTTEALAGGKTGKLYLVNTTDLGQEQANDAGAIQTLWFESDLIAPYSASCTDSLGTHTTDINSYEIFGSAAYFNESVYVGITPTSTTAPAPVRQFSNSATSSLAPLTPSTYTTPSILENSRGTTPFISADGTTNGVLWMIDHGQPLQSDSTQTSATLRAYDPNNLDSGELYDSNMAANNADVPGYGIKFTSPIVANGKVYISTGNSASPQGELDVYGLKGPQ